MVLEGAPSGCLGLRDQTVWLTPDPTLLHSPLDRSPLDRAAADAACRRCPCLRRAQLARQALRASPWPLSSQFLKRAHSALKAVQPPSVQRAFSDATVKPPVQESHCLALQNVAQSPQTGLVLQLISQTLTTESNHNQTFPATSLFAVGKTSSRP